MEPQDNLNRALHPSLPVPDVTVDSPQITPNGQQPPTGAQSQAGVNKRYRPAPAKTFQCRGFGECRMVFSRSEHLARHVRKHTGERPFACHCGKQFSRLDNLRQHAQTVHSDKIAENEIMMRELTSLHTQLAARTSKVNRDPSGQGPASADKQQRRLGTNSAGSNGSTPRPGTTAGYEASQASAGSFPPPSHPHMNQLAIPYQHQVPQYPPHPAAAYPSLPPTGPYAASPQEYHHPPYYPPANQQPQGPYNNPNYSPQYQHPPPGAPYPTVRYPAAQGSYPPSSASYGQQGQPQGPPSANPNNNNNQYPNGAYPNEGHSPGAPRTPQTPSSTTPLSAQSGAGQSFLGSGPPSAAGSQAGTTQSSFLQPAGPASPPAATDGGGHSFRASPSSGFGGPPLPSDAGSGSGFRERGVGAPNESSGNSNSASRELNQYSGHHGQQHQSGFSGAAGRGGPSPRASDGGDDSAVRYAKDGPKEIPTTGPALGPTSSTASRKTDPPGLAGGGSFYPESGFPAQRAGRNEREQSAGAAAAGFFRPGSSAGPGDVPNQADAQLTPLAALIARRQRERDQQQPPGSAGGFPYDAAEYERPGTAPASFRRPTTSGGVSGGRIGGGLSTAARHGSGFAAGLGERRGGAPTELPSRATGGSGGGFFQPPPNRSPLNDSPFTFHPPPEQQPRDRPGSSSGPGRPFARPRTGTTDPASYAFVASAGKRPYTADSSDGGSVSGRDSSLVDRQLRRPFTAVAIDHHAGDDGSRPPSRRLSLMELCTPPTTAGRPRTSSGFVLGGGGGGTLSRPDTGSRWTGKTAVDDEPELEPEEPAFAFKHPHHAHHYQQRNQEDWPTHAHPFAAHEQLYEHEAPATARDLPRSDALGRRDEPPGAQPLVRRPSPARYGSGKDYGGQRASPPLPLASPAATLHLPVPAPTTVGGPAADEPGRKRARHVLDDGGRRGRDRSWSGSDDGDEAGSDDGCGSGSDDGGVDRGDHAPRLQPVLPALARAGDAWRRDDPRHGYRDGADDGRRVFRRGGARDGDGSGDGRRSRGDGGGGDAGLMSVRS